MVNMVLQSIEGVGNFAAVSLIIFMLVFSVMLIKVFLLDKKYLKKMSKLPLDSDKPEIPGV